MHEDGSRDIEVDRAESIDREGDNAVIVDELDSRISRDDQIREGVMNVDEEFVNIEPVIELVEDVRNAAPPPQIR